jgi:hypothetical protein
MPSVADFAILTRNLHLACRFPLEMAENARYSTEVGTDSESEFHAKWRIPPSGITQVHDCSGGYAVDRT